MTLLPARIRWLIDFRSFDGCEKGTADWARREKEGKLGNAAQLCAHFELLKSIKSPEKRQIRAKSENHSLSCRLSGGQGRI
jgi:hypothetical protein